VHRDRCGSGRRFLVRAFLESRDQDLETLASDQLAFSILLKSSSVAVSFGHDRQSTRYGNMRLCRFAHARRCVIRAPWGGSPIGAVQSGTVRRVGPSADRVTGLIQVWFAAVALAAASGVAFGVAVTVGTGAILFALSSALCNPRHLRSAACATL
jgi:hypothetical protein